jgi:hypothetical protein
MVDVNGPILIDPPPIDGFPCGVLAIPRQEARYAA